MVDNIFGISSQVLTGAGNVITAIFQGVVNVFNSIWGAF